MPEESSTPAPSSAEAPPEPERPPEPELKAPRGVAQLASSDAFAERPPLALARESRGRPHKMPYAFPCDSCELMSSYYDVRGRRRYHHALDLRGVGLNSGLGTPIRAIGRSRIVRTGRSADEPHAFGRPLRRRGRTRRGGRTMPTSMVIPEYGLVYFFTRNYGRWRSGTILITELIEGPLAGYTVRYMHLGAIHPRLEPGMVVEQGEAVAVMGGTAVMDDSPHLHIDVATPENERMNPSPYLGLDNRGEQLLALTGTASLTLKRRPRGRPRTFL